MVTPAASAFGVSVCVVLLAAGLLPLLLGPHRKRLIDLGVAAELPRSLLFEFGDALLGRLQLPLQGRDQVDEPIGVDPSAA